MIAPPKVLPWLFLAVLYFIASLLRMQSAAMAVPMMHIRRKSWRRAKICGMRGRDVDDILLVFLVWLDLLRRGSG